MSVATRRRALRPPAGTAERLQFALVVFGLSAKRSANCMCSSHETFFVLWIQDSIPVPVFFVLIGQKSGMGACGFVATAEDSGSSSSTFAFCAAGTRKHPGGGSSRYVMRVILCI